jgi:hypothetical protein
VLLGGCVSQLVGKITETSRTTSALIESSITKINTTADSQEALSTKIASLIAEDGKGAMPIGMTFEKAKKVLNDCGINYVDKDIVLEFSDGSSFSFNGDDGNGNSTFTEAMLYETPRGLKVGDGIDKMKKLYGETNVQHYVGYYYEYALENKVVLNVFVDSGREDAKIQEFWIGVPPERLSTGAERD